MSTFCFVYGLYSTEDGVVRYIGQTTWRIEARRNLHLAEAARPPGTSHCHRWIRKVLRSGYEIGVSLLEAEALWDVAERKWIAEYREKHPGLLTNISDGGCGLAAPWPEERKQKMRRPKSPETREKIRKHLASPEMRKKMALGQRGNIRGRGEKNGEAVLTEAKVIEIHKHLRDGTPLSVIAKMYAVSKPAVSKIRTGRTWKHLGSWREPT